MQLSGTNVLTETRFSSFLILIGQYNKAIKGKSVIT